MDSEEKLVFDQIKDAGNMGSSARMADQRGLRAVKASLTATLRRRVCRHLDKVPY